MGQPAIDPEAHGAEPPSPPSTAASESEAAPPPEEPSEAARSTLSGATGKFLAQELLKWNRVRGFSWVPESEPQNAWEAWELGVAVCYDRPFGAFFNFIYDVLQFSSGRDKLCALMQGYAEFAAEALAEPDSERHWMYRGIEDSLSDGRKTFRLLKHVREVYKIRRGLNRLLEGIFDCGALSIPATCGGLDVLGHSASFFYYLFDNTLWLDNIVRAASAKAVTTIFGGAASVKRKKDLASIWRLVFAMTANTLLFVKAKETCSKQWDGAFQGLDDPRLFHTLELVGMSASFRILLAKLGYAHLSHAKSGLLAMLAAVCGIWSNWRKVRRKKCGTKDFVIAVERRTASCF